MENLRIYGSPPFHVAVIHGGPGAPGEMAPVARKLSSRCGVLEPLQAAASLQGQVEELRAVLQEYANPPVTLIGWSWGAWLALFQAAIHPDLVKKLILVGCGPFAERHTTGIEKTRMSRLSEESREEIRTLTETLNAPGSTDKDAALARLGRAISRADAYHPIPHRDELLECSYRVFAGVWSEAGRLRSSGELLELAKVITCPVLAVHGDYDPRPADGVREPLSQCLDDFRFILLKNCGHQPWIEREARDGFFSIIEKELDPTTID